FGVDVEQAPRLPVVYRAVVGEWGGPCRLTDNFWDKRQPHLRLALGQQIGDAAKLNRVLQWSFDRFDETKWDPERSHPATAPIRSCAIVGCTAFHHRKCCLATYERARRL